MHVRGLRTEICVSCGGNSIDRTGLMKQCSGRERSGCAGAEKGA